MSREARLAEAAHLYERAAADLELAAAHCRRAAEHFREREVPRGAAHAWAARGYVLTATDALDTQAREHARRSNL